MTLTQRAVRTVFAAHWVAHRLITQRWTIRSVPFATGYCQAPDSDFCLLCQRPIMLAVIMTRLQPNEHPCKGKSHSKRFFLFSPRLSRRCNGRCWRIVSHTQALLPAVGMFIWPDRRALSQGRVCGRDSLPQARWVQKATLCSTRSLTGTFHWWFFFPPVTEQSELLLLFFHAAWTSHLIQNVFLTVEDFYGSVTALDVVFFCMSWTY